MAGPSVPAERYFSTEEIDRANAYHGPLYRYLAARMAVTVSYLSVVAFSGARTALAAPVDRLPRAAFAALYTGVVLAAGAVISLPLSLWRHRYERRWGFSTQRLGSWFADWAKALAVSILVTGAAFAGLVSLAAWLPRAWPAVAAPVAALLVAILSFVGPVLLEPLFNRFRPMEDEILASELRSLAHRAEVPVRDVLVSDASRRTTKHNAYVSGLGATRRVVVYDTLVRETSVRDVRLVVAHELGHRRGRHVALGTALAAAEAAGGVVGLWALLRWDAVLDVVGATGASDPRIVPFALLLASFGGLLTLPLANAVSRRWEREADEFSVRLTHDPEGFGAMERSLALANLSELAPSRLAYIWLFTHPTAAERIAAAEANARAAT